MLEGQKARPRSHRQGGTKGLNFQQFQRGRGISPLTTSHLGHFGGGGLMQCNENNLSAPQPNGGGVWLRWGIPKEDLCEGSFIHPQKTFTNLSVQLLLVIGSYLIFLWNPKKPFPPERCKNIRGAWHKLSLVFICTGDDMWNIYRSRGSYGESWATKEMWAS